MLQPDLQVCAEGAEAWAKASDVPELAAFLGSRPASILPPPLTTSAAPVRTAPAARAPGADSPPRDLAPKLRELWIICRNASNDLLLEQKTKHWKTFFKTEQEIIVAECKHRGLL